MYVDHNATSPPSEAVRNAVADAMVNCWANANSPHRLGQGAAVQVEFARRQVATMMNCIPKNVFFTSGATEANAWVLQPTDLPVIASAVEHPSVLAWADEEIPVHESGEVKLDWLEDRLRAGPALVSVMAANNESGVLQPIGEVAALCRRYEAKFHCDATQVPGRIPVDIDADWITISAHKYGGPRGVGALIGPKPSSPLLRGGEQERGQRAGTSNVPGIIGMGVASADRTQVSPIERDKLEHHCLGRGALILGGSAPRLPNTTLALFDHPGDLIVAALDLRGIQASTGSACSSGSAVESHVVRAMGHRGTPVRFSLGVESRADDVIRALDEVLMEMGGQCA